MVAVTGVMHIMSSCSKAAEPSGVTHELEVVNPPRVILEPATPSSAGRYTPHAVIAAALLAAGALLCATPSRADSDTDWIRGAIHALQKAEHDWDAEDTKQVTPQ